VICPNCGENNSGNFRYCGMCGTSLEQRRPAGAPRTVSAETSRATQPEREAVGTRSSARTTAGAVHDIPPTSGPSFLGLNQPLTDETRNAPLSSASGNEPFAGLDSFFEPQDSGVSFRGIVILLVLVGALGAGGWWAYTHYNGTRPGSSPATTQPPAPQPGATDTASNNSASNPPAPQASSPSSNSAANAAPSQPAPTPTESAKSVPPPSVQPKSENTPPTPARPAEPNTEPAARNQKAARASAKTPARPSPDVAAAGGNGDAEFKRGEAYLYGRGVAENCAQAIKNLKDASAKQNAKARSTFGTMYATGHCVTRNLPTSYAWFALALRADPNNQILEKDLTAVWNQMTPPERQIAARTKP
jgi:hypothetical protein